MSDVSGSGQPPRPHGLAPAVPNSNGTANGTAHAANDTANGANGTSNRTAPTAPPARPFESAPAPRRATGRGGRLANRMVHAAWGWVARHGAIGPADAWAERFGAFGEGSCLSFPPGALFGEQWIHIGRDTLIGPDVSLSAGMVPGQQMITDPVVRIGDRCMIGRGSHIVGHFSIEIDDDVYTGPYVYVTDQNHGYEDPDEVVHAQWPNDVPVRIGAGSWIGTGVVILPGTTLGRNVVVGAGAVVRGEFPDHSVVAGVPARVLRRYVSGSGWLDVSPAAATSDTSDPETSDRVAD